MSSMSLRAVLLCALSPLAFGAGVTIELDTQVSIGSVVYTENDEGWINHDSAKKGLDSFQEVSVMHQDVISRVIFEQENLSIDIISKNNYLLRNTISENGYQAKKMYPAIENEFTVYGIIRDTPFIIDKVGDTIWQWGGDYWKDLRLSLYLPEGDFGDVFIFGEHYLLSVDGDVDNGLWEIGVTTNKISGISLADENASLIFTHKGALQFYKKDEYVFQGYWLEGDYTNFDVAFDFDFYPNLRSTILNNGTVLEFSDRNSFYILWLAIDEVLPVQVNLPVGWSQFKGCFGGYLKSFCIINTEDQGYAIYELVGGKFVLDTMLDQSFDNLGVVNIIAVGEYRFISAVTRGVGQKTYSLLSVNEAGIDTILEAEVGTENEWYSIITSRDPGVFYWVGREVGKTQLYKAKVSGGVEFKRNVEPAEQQGENTDGEANIDGSQDDDSDNGIGSLPVYSSLLLLLLLIPRAIRKTR